RRAVHRLTDPTVWFPALSPVRASCTSSYTDLPVPGVSRMWYGHLDRDLRLDRDQPASGTRKGSPSLSALERKEPAMYRTNSSRKHWALVAAAALALSGTTVAFAAGEQA